ncbi:MAG: ABC transporter permease [Bryobacterales bacterium]|nr:ABC transporter permease [Bryobacterales bacterium]
MESLRQNINHALRIFAHKPGFAATSVVLLALGIGANSAIFSILNTLVFQKLPVRQPEQLVEVFGIYRNGSKVPFSFPMFENLEDGQRVFSGLFGWSGIFSSNVEINRQLSLGYVRAVTGNYYSELGTTPALGRFILPKDLNTQVAVLGYAFWDRRFGRSPDVIGNTIRIEERLFTIIGVSSRWFAGMTPGQTPDLVIPITAAPFPRQSRSSLWVSVGGRLNQDVTIEQAKAQLQSFWSDVLMATVPTQSPGERRASFLSMKLEVESAASGVKEGLRSQFVQPLHLLLGITGLILLVLCVNLASLTLASYATRDQEMGTRLALGASQWQLSGQLLAESLFLSATGAVGALVIAHWGSTLLSGFMSKGALVPVVLNLSPDWRVFSFTASVALVTGLIIGVTAVWQVFHLEPASVLHRGQRVLGRRVRILARVLIVAQIAMSLVLLHGAGLFLRTLKNLRSFDPGFSRAGVFQVSLYPKPKAFEKWNVNSYRKDLIDRVASLPEVGSAAFSNLPVPVGEKGWRDTVVLDSTDLGSSVEVMAILVFVSPGFFKTLGIPLASGRDFDWTDNDEHPGVAIVDSELAEQILPAGNAVGERISFSVHSRFQALEVVGVVGAARLVDLRNANLPVVYVPSPQHRGFSQRGNLFVRASHLAAAAQSVENEIASLGYEYPTSLNTLDYTSEQALLRERAIATLATFFAILSLLLAAIGLFGLMSHTVTRRTREIGIRLALGSQRRHVFRVILTETLLLTIIGISVGSLCAFWATTLVTHMSFGFAPDDPHTLVIPAMVLFAIGAAAGYLPARRAMRMDPLAALRYD